MLECADPGVPGNQRRRDEGGKLKTLQVLDGKDKEGNEIENEEDMLDDDEFGLESDEEYWEEDEDEENEQDEDARARPK